MVALLHPSSFQTRSASRAAVIRRLGKITKAGSTHARRLLVEAALPYRLTPAVGGTLAVRQRGQDPALIDHAWRVQRRLHARWNLYARGAARRPAS
jgi:transposase